MFIVMSAPFVTCQPLSFSAHSYVYVSRRTFRSEITPTKLHTQTQIHTLFCPLSHIPSVCPFPHLHTFSAVSVIRFLSKFDSDCHTLKIAVSVNILISKSKYFAFFVRTDNQIILYIRRPSKCHYIFLHLWKICAIQPTRKYLTKCYKCSRCAYIHTYLVHLM